MIKQLGYILIVAVLLNACSNTKYLAPGQKLYTGGEVKINGKDIKKSDSKALSAELQALLRPLPNGSILGLRFKLYLYNITKTNRTKGIKHWLNKFGEPPVLVSTVDLAKNSSILQNRLQNLSYFQAQVAGDTVSKGKTAKAVYIAELGPAYKIRKVIFPSGYNSIDTAIAGTAAKTFLKPGDNYNLDVIKNERIRIDAQLKEEGFYFFAPENLIMKVDSTVADHHVDIFVKVKNDIAERAQEIYTIRNIYVYPSYSLTDTSLMMDKAKPYRWYNVVERRKTISSFAFANTVQLHPNDVYNRTKHNNSLNRFVNLGPYKYVKNRFEDVTPDSPKLDVYYFLTPYKRKSLQLEILGRTTSANYTGTQVNLNWKHRNAFMGAEALAVTLFGSTDVQVGGGNAGFNVFQAGITTTLSWPRFVGPISPKADNAYIPHTNLTLGYTLVNRQKLYTINSYNASFGYQWKENAHRTHELNLLNFTFLNPANVSQLYQDSIKGVNHPGVPRNPALQHVIDKQFTLGPSYGYTFTNTTDDYRTNTMYYNGKVSLSNNAYGLITGADTTAGKVRKLFGAVFNQYVKLENEFRFFHKTGPNSTIASRVIVGYGLPYGNSAQLPYSQQFFIGGPNSLRGFQARSIGPGSYNANVSTGNFLPDESGDIKLEANIEYRPKLFSIVRGALFMDAGNIWLTRSGGRPGAAFGKDFLNSIAVDAGFGLRFDVTVLVLRTDLGVPLRTPYIRPGQPQWNLDWHRSVFNLAIGYPF
jgi:outer membrane protein insertion porin family